MKRLLYVMALVGALILGTNRSHAEAANDETDTLVRIRSQSVDRAYLLPGADFSIYKKVRIAPSQITFQKDWLRNMNQGAVSLDQRIRDEEANRILAAARSGFDEIWSAAFAAAGYQVVTEPGVDVLEIEPRVIDLYINAPDLNTAIPTRKYTVETGQAALVLEVRDSLSGALLGRATDRRTAGARSGHLEWTTRVTNRSDFRRLFTQWATLAANGLRELAQASPLPETLRPGQKLPEH